MTSTTWTQNAGMDSGTDSDGVVTYAEAAQAAAEAAAASEAAAAASEGDAEIAANSATTAKNAAKADALASASSASAASSSASTATAAATAAASSAAAAAASAVETGSDVTAAETAAVNAASSAVNAGVSETNAASSATSAASSATSANASYISSASSAVVAEGHKDAAAASAVEAAGYVSDAADEVALATVQASNAATSASNAADSALDAAGENVEATIQASNAATSATAAATSASNAATSETNAATSLTDAESARDQSQDARDTANLHKLAAEAAATSATNTAAALTGFDLEAIAESKAVTAVDVFVYDTSKDSDGGAWRRRTQGTSWYNETLNTATRGSRREFPAVAVIVAETNKVTIYDGDDPALPMWMVFNAGTKLIYVSGNMSLSAKNGVLVVGSSDSLYPGLNIVGFISETSKLKTTVGRTYTQSVLNRNQNSSFYLDGSAALVNTTVNDIAMTVLPDAPIDPATGLPVPTIAVATAGGVSVIKDDGTVVDSSDTASIVAVDFNPENILAFTRGGNTNRIAETYDADGFGSADVYLSVAGYIPSNVSDLVFPSLERVRSGAVGLERLYLDTSALAGSLHSFTTSTYNTGWMNGDIKGAFLADTDDTDLVGSGELVTNGAFDTDISGWTDVSTGTGSISWNASGYLDLNGVDSSNRGYASQAITTVVGKVYTATVQKISGSVSYMQVGTSIGGNQLGSVYLTTSPTGIYSLTFVATTTTTYITVQAQTATTVDNISVKLADADRSVNNNGLIVNGTVTRSPVATGADLVAYSGFSASNYLEAPYNSDLDFGTGDFCVMGWVKPSATTFARTILELTGGLRLVVNTGSLAGYITGLTNSNFSLATGQWTQVGIKRSGTDLRFFMNGVEDTSITNSTNFPTPTSLRIGKGTNAEFAGGLALFRISATAPTADQIAKIYNDEKVLFQENAQATLYGASDAVTALAHDDATDLLHVGTSAGRSVFQGLRRVSNTTTAVGTAISASNNLIAEE